MIIFGFSFFFFFKQKTAYEIGLGIPAEPLFRSKLFLILNAWERAGADASSAGMVDAGFENQKELTKMQLDNQKEIAEMQNEKIGRASCREREYIIVV